MSERKDLLFELGTEEIPARFLPPAVKQMRQLAIEGLKELALDYNDLKVFTTPRRLVLAVYGLAAKQEDLVTEQKGPAKKAAYDAEGKPTRALEGFCKGQGVTPAELIEKEINGNIYLYAQKAKKGQSAQEVLPAFCADLINKIYFPKPMRWGYQEMRFARPVRWLILLFGDEVLDLTLADVKAGRLSRGHRVLGSQAVEIQNLASYEDALYKNYVIVDQAKRKEVIREQVSAVAKAEGGLPINDEELLDEVTYILEWP
ncbi:MAG: glycine--tRNA ligase subunit beta, partial [Clostridia bacterium]|nr:glycine--tRNA ligase subunit beta [Clostridia bacterium]